jgi:Flp pilus assembly protein TadD
MRKPIGVITLVVLITLIPACRRVRPIGQPEKRLKHFNGTIDHSHHTYDKAKSDLYVRASRALETGDAKTAEALYREAIARYPDDPAGHESLGACLYFQARYDDARAEYLQALKLDVKSVEALYGLGCVAYEEQRFEEAKERLLRALAIDKTHSDAHRMLGIIYDDEGDSEQALFQYQRAIALNESLASDDDLKQRVKELKK